MHARRDRRVASGLNGGYEKRVCRLGRATVPRGIEQVARPAWHLTSGTRGIDSVRWEMPVISGNWSRDHARPFEDSAWLISADQPRDKFMCRPEIYIYIYIRAVRRTQERESRKKAHSYSGYAAYGTRRTVSQPRRAASHDSTYVRGGFCPCARLHADSIPNRKRQRIH